MGIINKLDIKQNPIKGYHSYRLITGGTISTGYPFPHLDVAKGHPNESSQKKTAKATCFFCFFPGGMGDVEQMSIRISGYFRLLQFSGILSDVKSAKVGILLEVLVLFFDVFRSLKGLNILNLLTLVDHFWLVVSIPLKNMKVSWDDYSQYMEK